MNLDKMTKNCFHIGTSFLPNGISPMSINNKL